MSDLNLASLIKNMPMFSQFTAIEIEQLAQKVQQIRIKKSEVLFKRDENGNQIFYVIFGKIKLYHPTALQNESEKIFRIVAAGESFAEAVAFLKRPYPVNAEAIEDSLLLGFKIEALTQLLQSNPNLSLKMLAGLSSRIHTLHFEIESLRVKSGMERTVYYLASLINENNKGIQKIHLPTTKQNIASLLNIKPETFSRYLAALEKKNLIKVEGREIEIENIDNLKEYCESHIGNL
jgi:CRP-like cAMP-binding protein